MEFDHSTLKQNNERTIIITRYIPCKVNTADVIITIVVKQQWLIIQQSNRHEQSHKAAITDVIKEIKKFKNEGHKIIVSIDGNETFTQTQGVIAKLCRECKCTIPSRTAIMINKTLNYT